MLKTNKRRDWDLNPGGLDAHEISSLAPYQARLSRHISSNKKIFAHHIGQQYDIIIYNISSI